MEEQKLIKMITDVFAPQKDENVLFLQDLPHGTITDNPAWKDRRTMAAEWIAVLMKMANEIGFTISSIDYKATGKNNGPIPENVQQTISEADLVFAMTEYSATSSLMPICEKAGSHTRAASMPGVSRSMDETAFQADYSLVQKRARYLKEKLETAVNAEVTFSTGDTLFLDLRDRSAHADEADCTQAGQMINFPSGEAYKVPYEGTDDDILGESKTSGVLPVDYGGEIVRFQIKENNITSISGDGPAAKEMELFFKENPTRTNIAELGLGCNEKAVISGIVLEDEKVGLHIAYGHSIHLGGKVESDVHQDIVYATGCPIEGKELDLIDKEGNKTPLIRNSLIDYSL